MPTLLYIHGFLSSPKSAKAQLTQAWLNYHRPDWQYLCPYLSSKPLEAQAELDSMLSRLADETVYLLGSSLGGFWATYLAERYQRPAVLVNPAVSPQRRFIDLVGQPLKNYHTAELCTLNSADLELLEACDVEKIRNTDLYWLMVQTGDQTLDYRAAVAKYRGCRQTVEEGGSHAFEGFQYWLPEIVDFFEGDYRS